MIKVYQLTNSHKTLFGQSIFNGVSLQTSTRTSSSSAMMPRISARTATARSHTVSAQQFRRVMECITDLPPADPYQHASMELSSDTFQIEKYNGPCATNGQSSYDTQNTDNWSQNVVLCTKNMNLPLGLTSKGQTTFSSGTTIDVAGKSWLGALYSQALWSGGVVLSKSSIPLVSYPGCFC